MNWFFKLMSPVYHQPKVPKYWKLAEALREQIASGKLLAGAQLPSVAQMQVQYGISLSTVNQAVSLLEKDGLIVREQGRGTFVAQPAKPNAARTLSLVLHANTLSNYYIMELLAGVRSEAARQGIELLWLSDDDVTSGKNIDAVLMCCNPAEALALNLSPQIPQALLFQHSPDFTCIAADDFEGVKSATKHLLKLGHRRVAYLPASDYDSISRQRLAGYRAAFGEEGLELDEKLIKVLVDKRYYNYRKSAEQTMRNWLEEGWRDLDCTAILAHNDEAAIGIIKVLHEQGLQVPGDVSVVGFDGTELSELSTPSLTTIKVPLQEIGAMAVQVVVAQIQNGISPEPQRVILPVQLKLGESTNAIGAECKQPILLPNFKE